MPAWVAAMICSKPFSPDAASAFMSLASTALNGCCRLPFRMLRRHRLDAVDARTRTGNRSAARTTACRHCRRWRCARPAARNPLPPGVVTRATKSVMDFFDRAVVPGRQRIGLRARGLAARFVQRASKQYNQSAPCDFHRHRLTLQTLRTAGAPRLLPGAVKLFFEAAIPERLVDRLVDLLANALDIETGGALAWRDIPRTSAGTPPLSTCPFTSEIIVLDEEVI